MALGTGCGYNLINRRALPEGCEDHVRPDERPELFDANRRKLTLQGVITLKVRLRNTLFKTHVLGCRPLTVDVMIGTEFLISNVDATRPRTQMLDLVGGGGFRSPSCHVTTVGFVH